MQIFMVKISDLSLPLKVESHIYYQRQILKDEQNFQRIEINLLFHMKINPRAIFRIDHKNKYSTRSKM